MVCYNPPPKSRTVSRPHKIDEGGGDSLILQTKDGCKTSETTDPFLGGDAETLRALRGIPNVYQVRTYKTPKYTLTHTTPTTIKKHNRRLLRWGWM